MNNHLIYTLNQFNYNGIQIDLSKILNVYCYGSVVYNTNTDKSDHDYIIVSNQENDRKQTIISGNLNATLIDPLSFQKRLDECRIDMLECFFLNDFYKYETVKFNFKLDLNMLRRSFSTVCSNSFVKCKKKILIGENYIGKKSLFHSLRIADLGIQIGKYGKILDYTKPCSDTLKYETFRELLEEIMIFNNWNDLKDKYQNIANNLRSEFRIVAPLDIETI